MRLLFITRSLLIYSFGVFTALALVHAFPSFVCAAPAPVSQNLLTRAAAVAAAEAASAAACAANPPAAEVIIPCAPPLPPVELPCATSPEAQPARHVFFDIGTNDGGSVANFLTGRGLLKTDTGTEAVAHKESGYKDRPLWHVIAVEANPKWAAGLHAQCARYLAGGVVASCKVLSAALGTADGNTTLYLDTPSGSLGASILKGSQSVKSTGYATPVRLLDVLSLFRDVFPLRPQDIATVKLEVEGVEYDVLNRAMANGLIALWDEFYVEWHSGSQFVLGGTPEGIKAEGTQRVLIEQIKQITVQPKGWNLEAKQWE